MAATSIWSVATSNGYPPCYHLGRETFLTPVSWSSDGFPVFGNGGRVELEQEGSIAGETSADDSAARDDFDAAELGFDWNYLRNPDPALYSLSQRPGHLRLRGAAAGLDDLASPAWVGRRQRHFAVRAQTRLEFRPRSEREEAGLGARMNERHRYEIFITLRAGATCVVLRRRIGSLQAEVACQVLPASEQGWVLAIEATRDKYVFLYGLAEDDLRPLGEGETRYLSTEVAGGFTGVYFGLYATGNGAACSEPADFAWFDYVATDGDRA